MARKKAESNGTLKLPVAFGGVSVGDKTARLGVTVIRSQLSVAQASKYLCDRRLTGRIVARPAGALAEQGSLPGMEGVDSEISGVFDVKGFTTSGRKISAGLTFAVSEIDVGLLAKFAKREGVLHIEGVEDLVAAGEAEE